MTLGEVSSRMTTNLFVDTGSEADRRASLALRQRGASLAIIDQSSLSIAIIRILTRVEGAVAGHL